MRAFDIESLRIRLPEEAPQKEQERQQKTRDGHAPPNDLRFVKGPIPLAWLSAAARLPGKALAVGLAIWFLHGLKRRPIKITNKVASTLNIGRQALSRALNNLEGAGLIRAIRKAGCATELTLEIDVSSNGEGDRCDTSHQR